MIYVSFVFAFIAIIAMICSFFLSPDCSTCLSSISTVMSIILGIMSIVYSYLCNKSTDKLLKKIEEKYAIVVRYAQTNLIDRNIDEANFENVSGMIDKR